MESEKVYVTMFKMFSVCIGDVTINSDDMKSEKLLKLFAYLLYHNQRIIPSSELIDMLWYFDEVDNPIGALKNLVYRLRVMIKNKFGIRDLITTGKSSYSMNKNYQIEVDALLFSEFENELNTKEEYERLLELYKGKYLVEIVDDHSVITRRTYFDSMYIERVMEYVAMLEESCDYFRMEQVVRQAIEIDQLEEELYELLIRSLYYQKQYKQAAETYKKTTELLYKTLGIKPSESMTELFELIKKQSHGENADILDIQKELSDYTVIGAFQCEYGTFKEIYNAQARILGRLGVCDHICLVSVIYRGKNLTEKDQKYAEKVISKVEKALLSGLRIGDIFSRLSMNQFIALLPNCNYENAVMAMDRVLRKVRYSLNHTYFDIEILVDEVEPKG